jgi:hypothetical protein
MSKLDPSLHLLYWLLRVQHLAKKESSESGYAMVLVSIVTVMMFSLLAAYLTITNITKSATNAYTESNSNFYIAESGLNQRSNAIRQKFVNYATPEGISPGAVAGKIAGPENMAACIADNPANWGSGDFACQRVQPKYKQLAGAKLTQGANGNALNTTDYSNNINYTTYTFTSDRTTYADLVRKIPQVQPIPPGQVYAGLNAQEYRYTVYSTATSKQTKDLDARATTVLEMTFKNRVIPLFQFAAFYDGDLEMNSTSQMNINGRVHTNGNFYSQPTPVAKKKGADIANTRLLAPLTVAGSIYNRVDASSILRFGDTEVLISGDPNNPTAPGNDYEYFPDYIASRKTPLTPVEIAKFKGKVADGVAGATKLEIPQPGFLRKRDKDGSIGDYYGKADLRLEMVPKRGAGNVPFNFTAIKNGGVGGSCSGFDLSTSRQGSLNCTALTEGQLRSLQQPVMVKVLTDEERTRFCTNPSGTALYNPADGQALRALQVAIAAQNDPVTLSQLDLAMSHGDNAGISNIGNSLTALTGQSPVKIAAAKGGCFLPAPIQTLTGSGTANPNYYNWQSSYFDRRENRWIGMLQTNINSLTVWNRDGLYVDRDNSLTTKDPTTAAQNNAAFNGGSPSSTYDTNNLLFIRAAAKTTAPTGSFQKLGLGSADTTEGGLVLHATVSDDLDGNGTDDLTVDSADNLRNYIEGKRKSSYGFAISDGNDLPGSLTVVSDRGLYVQGDYNNIGATPTVPISLARQPASLIGDTIAILSNSCLDANARINCGITAGQNIATVTTVNAAFLSFTDASDGNIGDDGAGGIKDYSGGLNNYMRMVENWAGKNFNYTGSFVSLGEPQEFSGDYRSGGSAGYYNVPNRNFNYDLNFNAFDRLPPLTPNVVYLQQETFKRSYK